MILTRHFFYENWEESTHGLLLQEQHTSKAERFEYLIEDGNVPVMFGENRFSIIMIMHDLQIGKGKAIWRIESYDFETKHLLVHCVNDFEKTLQAFKDFEQAFIDAGHQINQPDDYEKQGGMERGVLARLDYHMKMNLEQNHKALANLSISFN